MVKAQGAATAIVLTDAHVDELGGGKRAIGDFITGRIPLPPRSFLRWLALAVVMLAGRVEADPTADDFPRLTDRVVADLAAGKPLVVQVHVPLCDNHIIECGNPKLGDGESPGDNLYWATSEGFVGWLGRHGSGWKTALHGDGTAVGDRDVLEVRVWTRTVAAPAAWRARRVPAAVPIFVVAFAWRGSAIDRALAAYWADAFGAGTRTVTLPDKTALAAGGAAQLVAYVGHNRLYDVPAPDWAALEHAAAPVRGIIAIACNTGPFMADHLASANRVPLVFTRDFLMASAGAFEGAVLAFAAGGGYRAIRDATARGYAKAGDHDLARIRGVFTNPSERHWGHWQ
jgi:hypothetical protein